jgi:hypothetical protein
MTLTQIAQEIDSLPPEAQKQVEDFIAFLKTRYKPVSKRRVKKGKLENEPFVGMWKDREDMRDGGITVGCRNKTELRSVENLLDRFEVIPLSEQVSSMSVNLIRFYRF